MSPAIPTIIPVQARAICVSGQPVMMDAIPRRIAIGPKMHPKQITDKNAQIRLARASPPPPSLVDFADDTGAREALDP